MSAYTHIFVEKNDTFIEVSYTGRSCILSHAFSDWAPWEHITMVTEEGLNRIYNDLSKEMNNYKDRIADLNKQINIISGFNNSIDEKTAAIHDVQDAIEEDELDLNECEGALWLVDMLRDAIQNEGVHVYAGCECGSDVSVQDIQK